jgi:hypothetical protein
MADTAAPGAEPSADAPVSNRSEKHKSTGPSGSAPTGGGGATPPNRPASGRNATTTTTTTTTSTVAKGGAAGPATLQLPPAVAEFGKRLDAAKQRSRFGFVRSNKRAYTAPRCGFVAGVMESYALHGSRSWLDVGAEWRSHARTSQHIRNARRVAEKGKPSRWSAEADGGAAVWGIAFQQRQSVKLGQGRTP